MAVYRIVSVSLFLVAACNGLKRPLGDPIPPVKGLVSRVLGEKFVSQFEYEIIPPDPVQEHDVFEIGANLTTHKPVLRGNNGVALASALNFYLKYTCNCSISWGRDGTGDQLKLPQPLPLPSNPSRMASPVLLRYYQNVCTVSYSMVWWNFSRWEREIDWMAMNGLNLILSFTGQEYVWQRFYSHLGLNDSAIKAFFSGPAFLAWQRMGNIQAWGGPLDDDWIVSQANLQKQIMARVRELGMINVQPGFAGHVPAALKDLYPNASFSRNSDWNGFNSTYSDDYLLQPNDTLFMQLGKIYYQMLIDEYGSDHVFNCDTYNEMNPESTDLGYLADVNKAILQTMLAVDEDAVFLMQGWLFHSGFWTNERIKAFLSGVPDTRMIILDLNSEQSPLWRKTESYFGKPFVWCLLHNYGGTRGIYGNLTTIGTSPLEALNTPGSTMVGVGMTPEAIEHNPIVYDLMGEMSWRSEEVKDVLSWVQRYAGRRYGVSEKSVQAVNLAWTYLLQGAYQFHWSWLIKGIVDRAPDFSMDYYSALNAENISLAWTLLATAAADDTVDLSVGPLQYDIVDIGRQCLVNLFADLHAMYSATYDRYTQHNINTSVQLGAIRTAMLQLCDDLDTLLASNTNFLLGHWIADARASVPSTSPREAVNNAEFNARNQITMWGPHQNIEDYASKEWAGLVKDYYKERWALFTGLVNEAVMDGKTFDRSGYESQRYVLEAKFSSTIKSYPTTPVGNLGEIIIKVLLPTYFKPDSVVYSSYVDTDASGNDIMVPHAWNTLVGNLMYLCNVNPECKGFNSNGYLKRDVSVREYSQGTILYVKLGF